MKLPNVVTLQVLLHTYCSPEPYPNDAPSYVRAYAWLHSNDLIKLEVSDNADGKSYWKIMPRGYALVRKLMDQRLPVEQTIWTFEDASE